MILEPLYNTNQKIGSEKSFSPRVLTENDFSSVDLCDSVKNNAILGSKFFKKRFDEGILFPSLACRLEEIDINSGLSIHNYTGKCPVQTYEINPVCGCNVGCAYCLVNDGIHEVPVVYKNYHKLVSMKLDEHRHNEHYFYFSPKTEAFCEATLATGIAHNILVSFIEHFEKYPDSKVRLFIASKSGVQALQYVYKGNSIIDLLIKLKGKMQFNTSVSIFPDDAIKYIEPHSCSLQHRLDAVKLCQENGIMANSALVQPILISILNEELLHSFFELLSRHGIVNFKPEFLTASVENMVLMAQILAMYDKDILKKIFEMYFQKDNQNHIKQRKRTAPSRDISALWINKMKEIARQYGISISICYWVREQLNIGTEHIPIINENGYKCLGYQTKLFQ